MADLRCPGQQFSRARVGLAAVLSAWELVRHKGFDMSYAGQPQDQLVRKCPADTGSDPCVGRAAGTRSFTLVKADLSLVGCVHDDRLLAVDCIDET